MTIQVPPPRVYVSFCAEIVPHTTEALLAACANLANSGTKEIYILLSTPGGSVLNGITLYNVLRSLPSKIIMHNVGSVNSIGNAIFLAGEERYSVPHATFMFHGVGFDITTAMRLEEKHLRERLDTVTADQKKIASIIRDRASFPDAGEIDRLFYEAATKDSDFARSRGLIHDIREIKIPVGAPIHQLVFKR